MSDSIVLHVLPPSSNSATATTFLKAAGVDYKEENCWGKTRTDEYIAKFPTNLAPAMEHGSVNVCEGVAIMRYCVRAFPDKCKQFYPETAAEQAKIDMICDYTNASLAKFFSASVYKKLGFPAAAGEVRSILPDDEEKADQACKQATEYLEDLLTKKYAGIFLKDTKFLCSDTPTIADFRFGPLLSQLKVIMKLPERLEKYDKDFYAIQGVADAMKPVDEMNKPKWV